MGCHHTGTLLCVGHRISSHMCTVISQQARSQGGSGGSYDPPPPVAHPKDFVPPFSNFVPPLEYVDDVTRAMSKGGGACECPRVGAFFKLMTSRGQCPRGGECAWCSTHPSSDPPPHLAGWLRACTVSSLCGQWSLAW